MFVSLVEAGVTERLVSFQPTTSVPGRVGKHDLRIASRVVREHWGFTPPKTVPLAIHLGKRNERANLPHIDLS